MRPCLIQVHDVKVETVDGVERETVKKTNRNYSISEAFDVFQRLVLHGHHEVRVVYHRDVEILQLRSVVVINTCPGPFSSAPAMAPFLYPGSS